MRSDDDLPDDPQHAPRRTGRPAPHRVRTWQIRAVAIVGGVAVITFLCSLLLDGSVASTLRTVATVAAIGCAVIGASFAITGNRS